MTITYDILEEAFYFVGSGAPGEHVAVISRPTGEVFYASAIIDESELPDDVEESDDYVEVPHKSDLDLGMSLAMEFIRLDCPVQLDYVREVFSRRGAYARYKAFLAEKELLQEWYRFENERIKEALLEWCDEVGLVVEEKRS
jgi:hypothetical protein